MLGVGLNKEEAPADAKALPQSHVLRSRYVDQRAFRESIMRLDGTLSEEHMSALFRLLAETKFFQGNKRNVVDLWTFLQLLKTSGLDSRRIYDYKNSRLVVENEFWKRENGSTNVEVTAANENGRITSKGSLSHHTRTDEAVAGGVGIGISLFGLIDSSAAAASSSASSTTSFREGGRADYSASEALGGARPVSSQQPRGVFGTNERERAMHCEGAALSSIVFFQEEKVAHKNPAETKSSPKKISWSKIHKKEQQYGKTEEGQTRSQFLEGLGMAAVMGVPRSSSSSVFTFNTPSSSSSGSMRDFIDSGSVASVLGSNREDVQGRASYVAGVAGRLSSFVPGLKPE